jgi:general secretion pathway protein C
MKMRRAPSVRNKSIFVHLATLGLWAAAAASLAYWFLQMSVPVSMPLAGLMATAPEQRGSQSPSIARALGHTPAQPLPAANISAASHYKLWGVIAAASGQGSALIAMGGQPPKAFQVGQKVDDDWTLTSLTPRQAKLNSPAGDVMLELPSPPGQP